MVTMVSPKEIKAPAEFSCDAERARLEITPVSTGDVLVARAPGL